MSIFQTMAECDCPRPAECVIANYCLMMGDPEMSQTPYPPVRPMTNYDITKPCGQCINYAERSVLARAFMGAQKHECRSEYVRGHHADLINGRRLLNPPEDCHKAREFGGKCGPEGRYFLPK